MSLNVQSYVSATYPPPLRAPNALPRIFTLHWNNSKVKTRRGDKDTWMEMYGTRYPDGRVTLNSGVFYRTMSEMEVAYEAMGSYRIEYLDEQKQEATHD